MTPVDNNTLLKSSSRSNKIKNGTINDDKNRIYLGRGVYVYKLNNTNVTSDWRVNNVDIPKLYHLSFPVSDNDVGKNSDNNNINHVQASSAIHPWILGLACFVGCLLVMVVITVIVLARKWMTSTWQDRHCQHPIEDRDDLVVVEADPDSPKVMSNLSLVTHSLTTNSNCILNPEELSLSGYRTHNSSNDMYNEPPFDGLGNVQNLMVNTNLNRDNRNFLTMFQESETNSYNRNLPVDSRYDFLPITQNVHVINSLDNRGTYSHQPVNITTDAVCRNSSSNEEQIFDNQQEIHQQRHNSDTNIVSSNSNLKQNMVCDGYVQQQLSYTKRNDHDLQLGLANSSKDSCAFQSISCHVAISPQLQNYDKQSCLDDVMVHSRDVYQRIITPSKNDHLPCDSLDNNYIEDNGQSDGDQSINMYNEMTTDMKLSDNFYHRRNVDAVGINLNVMSCDLDCDAASDDLVITNSKEDDENIYLHKQHFTL